MIPSELAKHSDGSVSMINMTVRGDGALMKREADMNAVIVQLIEAPQEDGTMEYRRVVSIMCKDAGMLEALTSEARLVLWALEGNK